MRKRCILFLIVIIVLLTGCENEEETIKNEYIAMKNNAFNDVNYQSDEELPVEITSSIERTNEEEITYQVVIANPKENMHHIKAMVVHNYYNEDVFPSVGVFDEPKELLLEGEKDQCLILEDTIKTTKDIGELDLSLKIWLEYTTDQGDIKDIYYKTT
ncbi:MAG: hypothetical protein MR598_06925 [Erysipelotrichaceae bacterium]|nr:hypothetical protein [Erysipelotrichaceae bacterium]